MKDSNNNGRISYGQYRLADLFLFMLIMTVCELVNIFAVRNWFPDMLFSVSLVMTATLIVAVRWNWWAAFFPVAGGVIYCWALGAEGYMYAEYGIGNAFMLLAVFLFKAMPKEKWFSKWYLTLVYPVAAYACLILGRAAVSACFGHSFVAALAENAGAEVFNLAFAVIALLIVRRFDGLLVDQKKYLFKVARERDAHAPESDKWEGYTELDEGELKMFSRRRDYDSVLPEDEYPPDSR